MSLSSTIRDFGYNYELVCLNVKNGRVNVTSVHRNNKGQVIFSDNFLFVGFYLIACDYD